MQISLQAVGANFDRALERSESVLRERGLIPPVTDGLRQTIAIGSGQRSCERG